MIADWCSDQTTSDDPTSSDEAPSTEPDPSDTAGPSSTDPATDPGGPTETDAPSTSSPEPPASTEDPPATTDPATRIAADSGGDSIEHGYSLPDDVISTMVRKNIFLVPTDAPLDVYIDINFAGRRLTAEERRVTW